MAILQSCTYQFDRVNGEITMVENTATFHRHTTA